MIDTCRHCTKRKEGCHSVCEDYINAKSAHEKQKADIAKAKNDAFDLDIYERTRAMRIKSRARKPGM